MSNAWTVELHLLFLSCFRLWDVPVIPIPHHANLHGLDLALYSLVLSLFLFSLARSHRCGRN